MQDEPEPPLKRQRFKSQSSQPNESLESQLQNQSPGDFDSPQSMGNESQPGSHPSLDRNKGKQPMFADSLVPQEELPSSQPSDVDKSLPVPRRAGSTSGSGIPVSPTKNAIANHTLIKPKDEPITDDLPSLEVPVAIIRPGRLLSHFHSYIQSCVGKISVGRRDSFSFMCALAVGKF